MFSPRQLTILLLLAVATMIAYRLCAVEREADGLRAGFRLAFSSSPAPPSVSGAEGAADVAAREAELWRHRESSARCRRQGGVPVFGYGWKVVCLKKSAYDWEEPPEEGHDRAVP